MKWDIVSIIGQSPLEVSNLLDRGEASHNPEMIVGVLKVDRIISEINQSRSRNGTTPFGADLERINTWIKDLETYLKYIAGQPQLDWVASHPDAWKYPAPPSVSGGESDNHALLLIDLLRIRRELTLAASNKAPSGIFAPDKKRVENFLSKVKKFIKDYLEPMAKADEVDYPESTGSSPNTDTDDGAGADAGSSE